MTEDTAFLINDEIDNDLPEQPEIPDPPKNSILTIWDSVLENARKLKDQRMTMKEAQALLEKYGWMSLSDLPGYMKVFTDILVDAHEVVRQEILTDPEAVHRLEEKDAEHNKGHYMNILIGWNMLLRVATDDWDPSQPDAAARMAGVTGAAELLVGSMGITSLMGPAGIIFDEEDHKLMDQAFKEDEDE